MNNKIKIALFASGSGTNVENIVQYFKDHEYVEVVHVFCNKPDAFVLQRAQKLSINSTVFNRDDFYVNDTVLKKLKSLHTDFIVLAGFLWLVPSGLVANYPNKIINIHPALLPKYGGKGMYGSHVHEAVVANKDSESGITIHMVNEHYDEGNIVFQAKINVLPTDNANDVASKIHDLEYIYFPRVIEEIIMKQP